jgi:hypothetical protein
MDVLQFNSFARDEKTEQQMAQPEKLRIEMRFRKRNPLNL